MIGLLIPHAPAYTREEVVLGLFVAVIYGIALGSLIGFVAGHICK